MKCKSCKTELKEIEFLKEKCAICGKEICKYCAKHEVKLEPVVCCWDNGSLQLTLANESEAVTICSDCEEVYNNYRLEMVKIIDAFNTNVNAINDETFGEF